MFELFVDSINLKDLFKDFYRKINNKLVLFKIVLELFVSQAVFDRFDVGFRLHDFSGVE